MASAFSICALVVHWRAYVLPGVVEDDGVDLADPTWYDIESNLLDGEGLPSPQAHRHQRGTAGDCDHFESFPADEHGAEAEVLHRPANHHHWVVRSSIRLLKTSTNYG